jgi:hypothetical protein
VQIWIGYLFLLMVGVYFASYLFFAILWYALYLLTDSCVRFPAEEDDGFLAAYMFSLETQARLHSRPLPCYSVPCRHMKSGKLHHVARQNLQWSDAKTALYVQHATAEIESLLQHTIYSFSMSMQATIGFGSRTVGVCIASAIVLTLQNVTGMILDAVTLGIIFAKLSHPKHRGRSVLISETATIARRDGQLKFMFRIADCRCASLLPCSLKPLTAISFTT